jgi:multicomponent Na+:H+ antiporter subunit D
MRAALIFMVVNLLGSVLFLSAVAALYRMTGTLDMQALALRSSSADPAAMLFIAALLFAAFSIKLGLFPFHFWLPLVYRDTQPAVAAILSSAVASIGGYGLLRFGAYILPRELEAGALVLILLGSVSILYGAYQAIAARSTGEVLAYSSVSQAGYILVALAVGGTAGYAAAVLYAVVNALNKVVLFLAIGLRGWLVGAAFVIGAFSVAGVPPSAGFFGKAAVFRAAIAADSAALVLLVFLGGALGFLYMFQRYQHDFWITREQPEQAADSPLINRLLVLAMAALVVLVGIWPEPLLAVSQRIGQALAGGQL